MFDDDALAAEEVAKMLRISKNSVYRLAQTGELPSYRVERKLRFTLRGIEAYTRANAGKKRGDVTSSQLTSEEQPASAAPSSALGFSQTFSLDERPPSSSPATTFRATSSHMR